jgi:hypothetical protein
MMMETQTLGCLWIAQLSPVRMDAAVNLQVDGVRGSGYCQVSLRLKRIFFQTACEALP